MHKKLTLSLEESIVDFAHAYSKNARRPISKIIEGYFIELKTLKSPVKPRNYMVFLKV
jgi:hypothetical protein